MRALKQDIVEIFGFAPNDRSQLAAQYWQTKICPFIHQKCTKTNHDNSLIYGTCSVSNGIQRAAHQDIVICPNRLYANNYATLKSVAYEMWGDLNPDVIVGGNIDQLKDLANRSNSTNIVIAFGKNSGREIGVTSNGQMSMDWILQRYTKINHNLHPEDFVGIEVQSIDITGNYRENHQAYSKLASGEEVSYIPDSGHGLNWANVHKRLVPQIIRKGNVYQETNRCVGFFFILPDIVYKKFEEVLGIVATVNHNARDVVSVMTYSLSDGAISGTHRDLYLTRKVQYRLSDIKKAFSHNTGSQAPALLDNMLSTIMD